MRAREFFRSRAVDAAFGALTTAFGAVTLSYPFARDHALFFYGAREWMFRGQVLYRDLLDHKPPLVYVIYMIAIGLFGQNAWGIRLLELIVGVPAMGWVAARLAAARGPIPPGLFGAAWLGAGIFDFGYLTYWDGSQCELWYTLLAVAALAVVLHARRETLACITAGVLSALAFWIKPPCSPFVAITLGAIVWRGWAQPRRWATIAARLGAFALGFSAISGCVLGYFAAAHALPQMFDLVVGVNSVQVRSGPGVHSLGDVLVESDKFFRDYEPISGVLLAVSAVCLVRGFARRDRALAARYALPALLAIASWASVLMQRKFYIYHRVTIIAAVAVGFAILYADLERALAPRKERWWLAPAAFAASAFALFVLSADSSERWYASVKVALEWKTGKIDREQFTRVFDVPQFYDYHDAELTGLWLREHAPAGDTLIVRGFEPEIYQTSGLHYTGRFCWSSFLTEPWRAYHLDQWLAEDLDALRAHPPHYAVALDRGVGGVEAPEFFERLGYVRRARFGVYVVLERAPG
jgi:hypothetical protein